MSKTSPTVKNRWNAAHYDRIAVVVPKGTKDAWKAIAQTQGKSLNQFIVEAVEDKIQ